MASKAERLQKQYEESIAKAKIAKSALDKIRRDQDRKEKIAARKARNHALFMVGGLAEIAGLLELDKGTLLGALVMISQVAQNPADQHTLKNWKNAGDALLAEREATRKKTKSEPVMETTSEAITNILSDNAMRD
ncbi:MAG: conjugal transfer protein TraD [Acidithiobacillus sp.]